jgi:hypothetical protein
LGAANLIAGSGLHGSDANVRGLSSELFRLRSGEFEGHVVFRIRRRLDSLPAAIERTDLLYHYAGHQMTLGIRIMDRKGRFSGYYKCSLCAAEFRRNPKDPVEMSFILLPTFGSNIPMIRELLKN